MELIKNMGISGFANDTTKFCGKCRNEGRVKMVQESDRKKFEEGFDRLDDLGTIDMYLCNEKAMKGCRYDYYYCPDCEKGLRYKDQYPKYECY